MEGDRTAAKRRRLVSMAQAGFGHLTNSLENKEKSESASLSEGPLIAGRVGGLKSAIIHIVPGEDHTVVSTI